MSTNTIMSLRLFHCVREILYLDILVQRAFNLNLDMNTSRCHDFKYHLLIVHKESGLKSDYSLKHYYALV